MRKLLAFSVLLLWAASTFAQIDTAAWLRAINRGKTEYAAANYRTAIEQFTAASRLVPTDTVAYVFLLDCAQRTKNQALAEQSFTRLQTVSKPSGALYAKLASVQREANRDFVSAGQTLANGKKLFPTDKTLLYEELLYWLAKPDFAKLEPLLTAYIKKFPGEIEPNKMMLKLLLARNEVAKASALVWR